MMHSNAEQTFQLLVYMGCGGICGVVLALRRVIAAYTHPSVYRRFAGDCVFCLLAVIFMFLVALSVSAGELRMTTIGVTALGCVTMQAIWLPVFTAVFHHLGGIISVFRHLIKRTTLPITRFASFFCKKIRFFCKKGLRYKYVMMYNDDE